MMKKSEASRTFSLAGGVSLKSWGRGAEASKKKKVRIEKRGAVLMRSSENPPQLNKIHVPT